jgi:hypothetical protein
LRRCSSPARSWREEEGAADRRARLVSDAREESARAVSNWASPRGAGKSRLGLVGPSARERGSRPVRAGLQAASSTGKLSLLFLFVFKPFKIDFQIQIK